MKLQFKVQVYGCAAYFGCKQCLSLRLTSVNPLKWHCGISKGDIRNIHQPYFYGYLKLT